MDLDDEIIRYVSGRADVDKGKLSRNSKFEDLRMDSLDMAEMVRDIEQKYKLDIVNLRCKSPIFRLELQLCRFTTVITKPQANLAL